MNFGQNLYQWFLTNAQSLVLLAIVVIGLFLGFKREFSKLIGFLVIALSWGVFRKDLIFTTDSSFSIFMFLSPDFVCESIINIVKTLEKL